jgi:hypothetical protein
MVVEIHINGNRHVGCREWVKACRYRVLEWLDDGPIVVDPREDRLSRSAGSTVLSMR